MIPEKTLFELGIRTAYIKNGILHIDQYGNGNYIQDNQDNITISDYGTHYTYFLIDSWNKLIYPANIIHPIKSYESSLIELINRSDKKDKWLFFPSRDTFLISDYTTYKYDWRAKKVKFMDFSPEHLSSNRHFVALLIATEATYVIYSYFRNFHIAFLKPAP